jgi:hypothetical protein
MQPHVRKFDKEPIEEFDAYGSCMVGTVKCTNDHYTCLVVSRPLY